MDKPKGETEVASLSSVTLEDDTGDVYITFKVRDPAYRSMVLQVAKRPDIKMNIRGEKLFIAPV